MTGRDAAEYILINHYDDQELVIYQDGKRIPIRTIVSEPSGKELVILLDHSTEN